MGKKIWSGFTVVNNENKIYRFNYGLPVIGPRGLVRDTLNSLDPNFHKCKPNLKLVEVELIIKDVSGK